MSSFCAACRIARWVGPPLHSLKRSLEPWLWLLMTFIKEDKTRARAAFRLRRLAWFQIMLNLVACILKGRSGYSSCVISIQYSRNRGYSGMLALALLHFRITELLRPNFEVTGHCLAPPKHRCFFNDPLTHHTRLVYGMSTLPSSFW